MAKKRSVRGSDFKARVALAAVQEHKTVPQLCSLYGVHSSQVHQWKKQLLEGAVLLFQDPARSQEEAARQTREAELYEQIGRLNMELEWLKKKVASGP
jgi:transposase-like protein